MKATNNLTVLGNFGMKKNVLTIHPNDGYDIDLLGTSNDVKIFVNVEEEVFKLGNVQFVNGEILLENKAQVGTATMNQSYWKELGKPKRIVLTHEEGKILISPV